ncbi:hypothetical protein [Paenisporosarcina antarctica]|uniref:hypothetical protein n=1 Tax=Paenisporosarcina antarctica TaxID=417367 RepID=UPI0014170D6A|nr:hypothetical protein [Paenisporosarcina antarctica]
MLRKFRINQIDLIRTYSEDDFKYINSIKGWTNLLKKNDDTKEAWSNSNVAFIVEADNRLIGCIRGLTDGFCQGDGMM